MNIWRNVGRFTYCGHGRIGRMADGIAVSQSVRPTMIGRILCYFSGHRPRRNYFKPMRFSAWTLCGRCDAVMVRSYYGWTRANDTEERALERALASWAARDEIATEEKVSGDGVARDPID